jgi:hypothetical protein
LLLAGVEHDPGSEAVAEPVGQVAQAAKSSPRTVSAALTSMPITAASTGAVANLPVVVPDLPMASCAICRSYRGRPADQGLATLPPPELGHILALSGSAGG